MSGDAKLSPTERRWLRMLASGATVESVADAAGYSARHMRRLLADVYGRLGANGRITALLTAAELGLLHDEKVVSGDVVDGVDPSVDE